MSKPTHDDELEHDDTRPRQRAGDAEELRRDLPALEAAEPKAAVREPGFRCDEPDSLCDTEGHELAAQSDTPERDEFRLWDSPGSVYDEHGLSRPFAE